MSKCAKLPLRTDYFESPRLDKCIRAKSLDKNHHFVDGNEQNVINSNCHDVVKIYVKGQCEESCQKFEFSSSSMQNSEITKTKKPKLNCFGYQRKTTKKIKVDSGVQTCPALLNNAKTQSSEIDISEILKNSTKNDRYNSFIYSRDKCGGDGLALLENWLKLESKTNTRQMEDMLGELHKQRRDMQDLKELLETVVKAVREQFFMTAFGKGKAQFLQDLNHQNNLERKSNTLSIAKSTESEETAKARVLEDLTNPEEKKRKRFFPWCI